MKIILDIPDVPELLEQVTVEWLEAILEAHPEFERLVKTVEVSNTQTASHIYKCAVCGHSDFYLK
jgi:hypothetical protein